MYVLSHILGNLKIISQPYTQIKTGCKYIVSQGLRARLLFRNVNWCCGAKSLQSLQRAGSREKGLGG